MSRLKGFRPFGFTNTELTRQGSIEARAARGRQHDGSATKGPPARRSTDAGASHAAGGCSADPVTQDSPWCRRSSGLRMPLSDAAQGTAVSSSGRTDCRAVTASFLAAADGSSRMPSET